MAQLRSASNFTGTLTNSGKTGSTTSDNRQQLLLSGGGARLYANLMAPPKFSMPGRLSDGSSKGWRQLRRKHERTAKRPVRRRVTTG